MADAGDLYDEFGNYIGPELSESEEVRRAVGSGGAAAGRSSRAQQACGCGSGQQVNQAPQAQQQAVVGQRAGGGRAAAVGLPAGRSWLQSQHVAALQHGLLLGLVGTSLFQANNKQRGLPGLACQRCARNNT